MGFTAQLGIARSRLGNIALGFNGSFFPGTGVLNPALCGWPRLM